MLKDKAYDLIDKFKGNSYIHGLDVLNKIGNLASEYGQKALLVANQAHQRDDIEKIIKYLNNGNT